MKNLIGSLAEDFHCFETWALSNQGKIKWKKIHARQLTLKNIHATA